MRLLRLSIFLDLWTIILVTNLILCNKSLVNCHLYTQFNSFFPSHNILGRIQQNTHRAKAKTYFTLWQYKTLIKSFRPQLGMT